MVRTKPLIYRHQAVAVITVVQAMVQLVMKRRQKDHGPASKRQRFIAAVTGACTNRVPLHVKENVNRMRGQHGVNQHTAEIQKVLNGVHGKSRPGPGALVSVVHCMYPLIYGLPVQETVHKIKMERIPEWNSEQHQGEPYGMFTPVQVDWQHTVGVSPDEDHFITRPQCHTARATPKDIIQNLVPGKKFVIATAEFFGVEFKGLALAFEDIEIKMELIN